VGGVSLRDRAVAAVGLPLGRTHRADDWPLRHHARSVPSSLACPLPCKLQLHFLSSPVPILIGHDGGDLCHLLKWTRNFVPTCGIACSVDVLHLVPQTAAADETSWRPATLGSGFHILQCLGGAITEINVVTQKKTEINVHPDIMKV
jgi:hypothetical protein